MDSERERASERDCERDLLRVRDTGERERAREGFREKSREGFRERALERHWRESESEREGL